MSEVTHACVQSTEPPDRCGYRHLAAPHYGVQFQTYAHFDSDADLQRGDCKSLSVEYRGLDSDLIAAGIVTAEFLLPRPGRRRLDAAGRRVTLQRRLEGIRVVTFRGDPFAEPRLPAITRELFDEAIEERQRCRREYLQCHPQTLETTPAAELPSSLDYQIGRAIGRLVGINRDDPTLGKEVLALLGELEAKLMARKRGSGRAARSRPEFLRLVVDNTPVSR